MPDPANDPARLAALGRRYADDLHIVRGAINAAILTRPTDADTVVVDLDGCDLRGISLVGPGGYGIGPRGECWKITARDGVFVLVEYDAIETRAMFGEPAGAVERAMSEAA